MDENTMKIDCKCGKSLGLKRHEGLSYTFSIKCGCGRYWVLEDMSENLKENVNDAEIIDSMF